MHGICVILFQSKIQEVAHIHRHFPHFLNHLELRAHLTWGISVRKWPSRRTRMHPEPVRPKIQKDNMELWFILGVAPVVFRVTTLSRSTI